MTGYYLPLSCPHCGGEVSHVVSSKVCAGTEASAIGKCARCCREWQVQVTVRPVPNPDSERRARYPRLASA